MKAFEKFKCWFRDSAVYRHFLSAIIHPKKFIFLQRYPFWRERNVWSGRFCGYDYSMYDWLPKGWKIVFGEALTHDIAEALRADGIRKGKWSDSVQWQDIKEKYGSLRLYAITTDKVQAVLSKYECLSLGYCINCGKPARYRTLGWIEYICEDCSKSYHEDRYVRLSSGDMPVYYISNGEKDLEQTPLERFDIDLKKIWSIDQHG